MKETIGIIATVFVLISFLCTKPISIRTVNLIGAVLFVIYGILIEAISVWLLNGVLIAIQTYHIIKIKRGK